MKKPLSDIRVLDFTHAAAGPYATLFMGDMGAEISRSSGSGWFGRAKAYVCALVAVIACLVAPLPAQAQVQTFFVNVPAASEQREAMELCRDRCTAALVRVGGFRANQDAITQQSVTDCLGETASATAKRECEVSMANIEVDFLIQLVVRRLGTEWNWGIKALSPAQGAAQVWGGDQRVGGDASEAGYEACDSLARQFACDQGVSSACVGSGFGAGPILGAEAATPAQGSGPARAQPARARLSAVSGVSGGASIRASEVSAMRRATKKPVPARGSIVPSAARRA